MVRIDNQPITFWDVMCAMEHHSIRETSQYVYMCLHCVRRKKNITSAILVGKLISFDGLKWDEGVPFSIFLEHFGPTV